MKLWQFFSTHATTSVPAIIVVAGLSGLSNAALLTVINSAAHSVSEGVSDFRLVILFGIVITLYILCQRHIIRTSYVEIEKIIETIRIRIADKIRSSDLYALEGIGRSQLYAGVNRETLTLSQAAAPIIIAVQGAIMVMFSLVYIYILSSTAFFLTVLIIAVGLVIHLNMKRPLLEGLAAATTRENELFDSLTHLVDGFKEVKLSKSRNDGLFAHIRSVAHSVATLKSGVGLRLADYYVFNQVLFYLLIGAIVFLLPSMTETYSDQVTRITAAALFIVGPLTMVVGSVQVVANANNAVRNISMLESVLDKAQKEASDRDNGGDDPITTFETIELSNLEFSYRDSEGEPAFKVGPLDLTIRNGETLFVVGGNGSGKSTMLKLLTALYYPSAGRIALDEADIHLLGYQNYRELFTAVFSDYHLFDRLYGMNNVEPRRISEMLRLMQLDEKTSFREGRFEHMQLSTGQRKRLALIVCLLDDKPVTVFDEWAADQDPEFREFFYRNLLPNLKRQGKTIIAATHDDRYFDLADRVVKMELGRFVPVSGPGIRSEVAPDRETPEGGENPTGENS